MPIQMFDIKFHETSLKSSIRVSYLYGRNSGMVKYIQEYNLHTFLYDAQRHNPIILKVHSKSLLCILFSLLNTLFSIQTKWKECQQYYFFKSRSFKRIIN